MDKVGIEEAELPKAGWWKTLSGKVIKVFRRPNPTQMVLLGRLQYMPVYQGTANRKKVVARRAKNKVARRQRKVNRAQR